MISFANPFLSLAGQAERLTAAGKTILAAVTGKGVTSNTGIAIIDKPLSAAASNPFVTAGIAAVVVNPAVALAAGKELISKASGVLSKASVATKAKVAVGAAIVIPAIIANPISTAQTVAKAPSAAVNIESNLVKFFQDPSLKSAATIFKENPLASGAIAVGGLIASGATVATAASLANTLAVKQSTKATKAAVKELSTDVGTAFTSPDKISDQASAPILATQSSAAVPAAAISSTPLKSKGTAGIVSSKKRGKRTKHRRKMINGKCPHRKVFIDEHLRVRYGGT